MCAGRWLAANEVTRNAGSAVVSPVDKCGTGFDTVHVIDKMLIATGIVWVGCIPIDIEAVIFQWFDNRPDYRAWYSHLFTHYMY